MLCVTGVYLRDVNVSHPRVCSAVRTVCVFCVSFFSSCRKVHKYYTSKGIFCGILMLILCICFTRWSAFFAKVWIKFSSQKWWALHILVVRICGTQLTVIQEKGSVRRPVSGTVVRLTKYTFLHNLTVLTQSLPLDFFPSSMSFFFFGGGGTDPRSALLITNRNTGYFLLKHLGIFIFMAKYVIYFKGKGAAAERSGNGPSAFVHQTSVQEERTRGQGKITLGVSCQKPFFLCQYTGCSSSFLSLYILQKDDVDANRSLKSTREAPPTPQPLTHAHTYTQRNDVSCVAALLFVCGQGPGERTHILATQALLMGFLW